MIKNKSKTSHNTKMVMRNELNKIFESSSEVSKYLGHSNGYVSDIIIKNKKVMKVILLNIFKLLNKRKKRKMEEIKYGTRIIGWCC